MPRIHGQEKYTVKTCKGDERMMAIRKTLNELGYERSKMQRQFHESFIQAVALHLYKDDPDVDMEKLMRMNNWADLRQSVLCLTPRRFGKTTAVAMFIAAYAMCVPHSVQSVFSTGRRASQKLLELIKDIVKKTPASDHIVKANQEELILKFGSFDLRKIASYPSHAKTLRGVGGDVLYLEEAAFLDTEVFNQIIVPLLEMDTTALIGISTPQDSQNFYSEMFELKDATGQNFFRTIRVSLVCQACQDAGKGSECTHNQDLIPPWKSAAKLDLVRALYGDNKDLMEVSLWYKFFVFRHTYLTFHFCPLTARINGSNNCRRGLCVRRTPHRHMDADETTRGRRQFLFHRRRSYRWWSELYGSGFFGAGGHRVLYCGG